jgi:hypothetical protein
MSEKLAPGEIALLGPAVAGHQAFVRIDESGGPEVGLLVPSDCPNANATAYLEMGEMVRPGVRTIKQLIRFTAKGPSQVASNAYRSGWDEVFGVRGAEGKACGPSQSN